MAPQGLAALAAGTVAGIGLAVWGLRLTRFENAPDGFFYTPNAHIGIALSLLLFARVGYRLYTLSALAGPEMGQTMQAFGRSPLTLVILGTMLGYFASYAIGLLRWRRAAAAIPLAVSAP
jgi:cytochrome b561